MTLMRRDFLLSGTLAAAAMTSTGPILAQSTGPAAPAVPAPPADAPYEAPKEVKALKITNLFDLETMAEKILPAGGFGYISAGSGVNWTRYENMVAFDRIHIEPQSLSGHANVDLTVDIIPNKRIGGPRVENPTSIIAMGLAGGLDDAFKAATSDMATWLAEDYKLTPSEIAQVLGTAAEYHVSEVADRNAGVILKINRARLATLTK